MSLRGDVSKRKGLPADRVQADVPAIRSALLARHPTYIDAQAKSLSGFESQVAQVYREMTGKEFPKKAAMEQARQAHEHHHGIGRQ